MLHRLATITVLVIFGSLGFADAQQPSIKRTPLQKFELPGTNYDGMMGIAEIVPNANIGRHSHPGVESGYVLEGELTLVLDGEPPLPLVAGQSYRVPAGVIHDGRSGDKGAKVIATYITEKGKPLATPAP